MMTFLLPPSRGTEAVSSHADALQATLSTHLGEPVHVEVARNYAELERRLLGGEVELAWAPPILCARAEPTARAILSIIRVGRSAYRAALVGRVADGLTPTSLADTRAAWADPLSTGGYLLPVAFLRLLGQEPDRVFREQRFWGSYRATLEAVADGLADVTALYTPRAEAGAAHAQMEALVGPAKAASLTAFAFTEEVPADGLVVGERVEKGRAASLARSLLALGQADAGANALLAALAAQRLVPARDDDYRPLRALGRHRPLRG